jgi:hypothetical protein
MSTTTDRSKPVSGRRGDHASEGNLMTKTGTHTGAEATPRSHGSLDDGNDPSTATGIYQRADPEGGASSGRTRSGKLFSGVKGLSRVGGAATTVGSKGLSTAVGGGRRLAVGTGRTAKNLAGQAGGLAVESGRSARPLVGQAGGLLNTALRNEQVQEVGFALVEGFLGPRATALVEKAAAGRSQAPAKKKATTSRAPTAKAVAKKAPATKNAPVRKSVTTTKKATAPKTAAAKMRSGQRPAK